MINQDQAVSLINRLDMGLAEHEILDAIRVTITDAERLFAPAYIFHKRYDIVLLRPEHLGLTSWGFQVQPGWNDMFNIITEEKFYHIFFGFKVFQTEPTFSAYSLTAGGENYPVGDASIFVGNQVPYYVTHPSIIIRPEKSVKLIAYFMDEGNVSIIPVGLTVGPTQLLCQVSGQVGDALPASIICSRCREEIKVEKNKGRVDGLIENLREQE